jgi:hypothetical protein
MRAVARPIPDPVPVITALSPFRSLDITLFLKLWGYKYYSDISQFSIGYMIY